MATTTFTDGVTLTAADWFNDVDAVTYDGATTKILVGGGAGSVAVWTTATGSGSPVRAVSPTFTGTLAAAAGTFSSTLGVSGVTSLAAGTVAAPGLYLAADTGTGLYRIGANNYGFSVSGTKIVDFLSTGLTVTGILATTTTLLTGDPAGGTAVVWRLGSAAVVSPTSPNRTVQVEVAGTIYYLSAKTTND